MAHWDSFHWDDGSRYDEPETNGPIRIKPTHMIELHKFLTNPFDDPHISLDDLLAFTTDHLHRMEDNSTVAQITARILPTTTAVTGVNTAFQADQSKLGLRKTSKQAKAAFRKTLPAAMGKIYVALQSKFGEKSPQLATFFPK